MDATARHTGIAACSGADGPPGATRAGSRCVSEAVRRL